MFTVSNTGAQSIYLCIADPTYGTIIVPKKGVLQNVPSAVWLPFADRVKDLLNGTLFAIAS